VSYAAADLHVPLEICATANRGAPAQPDALASWNEGPVKKSIADFIERVTMSGGREFVPPAERIAVFDNDGTLWSEQPVYFQAAFAIDRVKALAPQHPEWKKQEPFRTVAAALWAPTAPSGLACRPVPATAGPPAWWI
jgi:hypothetical protein